MQTILGIIKGAFVQFVFNIDTVIERKMFLVARDIFTYGTSPSIAVRMRNNYNIFVYKSRYYLCRDKLHSKLKE